MLPQVFVTDFLTTDPTLEREELAGVADVTVCAAAHESELAPILDRADALIVWHIIHLTAATIDRLSRCRVVVRAGVGYDNVAIDRAAERGLPVCNVPDYGTEEVADHALTLGLSLLRRVPAAAELVRGGDWAWRPLVPVRRLRGLTVGVVGLGRIGTATALRWKAMGCDVCFQDPHLPDGVDKALGLRRCEALAELLAQSDLVTLHVPLAAATRHLIDAAALAAMRDDAVLVNTARGEVVDTAAVLASLDAGRLRGVGIDVLPEEPPRTDPLCTAWREGRPWSARVLLTPHVAWYSEEGHEEMRRKAARTVRRVLLGQPVRNVVNGVTPDR